MERVVSCVGRPIVWARQLAPLTELGARADYLGEDGGLYGRGRNEPTPEHAARLARAAAMITPVDALGRASSSGRVGLVSIGMSNATREFSCFVAREAPRHASGPLTIVDGAQDGEDVMAWAAPGPWAVLAARLAEARLSRAQVQIAWVKQALIAPADYGRFPKHARVLEMALLELLRRAHDELPNLRLVYLSSRTFGGYAEITLNPEPFAYESAFVVRRLIQRQVAGDLRLAGLPALAWGPYLWAAGPRPRLADGLSWVRRDFELDGTHPSPRGEVKVAGLLSRFFRADPYVARWFAR